MLTRVLSTTYLPMERCVSVAFDADFWTSRFHALRSNHFYMAVKLMCFDVGVLMSEWRHNHGCQMMETWNQYIRRWVVDIWDCDITLTSRMSDSPKFKSIHCLFLSVIIPKITSKRTYLTVQFLVSYTLQKDPDYSAQFTCLPTEVAISDLILLTFCWQNEIRNCHLSR